MFCFDATCLLQVDIDTDWAMVGAPFVGPDKGLLYAPHCSDDLLRQTSNWQGRCGTSTSPG